MPTAWSVEAYGEDGSGKQLSMDQHVLFDRARAAENYRWFISSNFAGRDDGVDYIGMSQIVDPSGRVVASTPAFAPEVAVADVRIGDGIAKANSFRGARLVRDRRPDTYAMTSGRVPPQVDG
jgi:predicted amidohydrolase